MVGDCIHGDALSSNHEASTVCLHLFQFTSSLIIHDIQSHQQEKTQEKACVSHQDFFDYRIDQ